MRIFAVAHMAVSSVLSSSSTIFTISMYEVCEVVVSAKLAVVLPFAAAIIARAFS